MSKTKGFQLYEVEPVSSIRNLLEIADREVPEMYLTTILSAM